jgi:hypothetical protein
MESSAERVERAEAGVCRDRRLERRHGHYLRSLCPRFESVDCGCAASWSTVVTASLRWWPQKRPPPHDARESVHCGSRRNGDRPARRAPKAAHPSARRSDRSRVRRADRRSMPRGISPGLLARNSRCLAVLCAAGGLAGRPCMHSIASELRRPDAESTRPPARRSSRAVSASAPSGPPPVWRCAA